MKLIYVCLAIFFLTTKTFAQSVESDQIGDHAKGDILFQIIDNQRLVAFEKALRVDFFQSQNVQVEPISTDLKMYVVHFDATVFDENKLLEKIKNHPSVLAAQFNHFVQQRRTPNDPLFGQQWAMSKINAPALWDVTTGGTTACGDTIVVALLDVAIDDKPADLQANIWLNRAEIPNNGLDDDGDGFVDDYRGYNFVNQNDNHKTPSATDANLRHGTKCAGVIGASGNNGTLISGINWKIKIMLLSGCRDETNIIKAYDYVIKQRDIYKQTNGKRGAFVPITSFSAGFSNNSPTTQPLLCAVFDRLGQAGILNFLAVANDARDVEAIGDMPTLCNKSSIVSVTSSDANDAIADNAAFSTKFVQLVAPGKSVLVLSSNDQTETDSGTSFATPLVAGAAALLWSSPDARLCQLQKSDQMAAMNAVKNAILRGVDVVENLKTKTATGGRLNVLNAYNQLRRGFGQPIGDYAVLKIFPNPVDKNLFLQMQLPETVVADLVVVNAVGQVILRKKIEISDLEKPLISIDTRLFPNGMYFVAVQTTAFEVKQKFVVARQ